MFFLAYPFNRSVVSSLQVLFILSSLASLFNSSAVRICSSLFLFSNGVFSTLFIFVAYFLSICSTSQGSLVSLVCRRSNLVLPLLFLFRFSPAPSYISGRDPLVVVECCNAPRPTLQMPSLFCESAMLFICLLHLIS